MMWILTVLIFFCGKFVITDTPPAFYHVEENNNLTIKWDIQTKTDWSLTNLHCYLQSDTVKILYEIINGNEYTESQHQQFAGRVQLDKDALREGRVRLHLSTVTAEDSGNYLCDLMVNHRNRRSWELEASEHFVLSVNQTSDEENINTAAKEPAAERPVQSGGDLTTAGPVLGAVALTLLLVYVLCTEF